MGTGAATGEAAGGVGSGRRWRTGERTESDAELPSGGLRVAAVVAWDRPPAALLLLLLLGPSAVASAIVEDMSVLAAEAPCAPVLSDLRLRLIGKVSARCCHLQRGYRSRCHRQRGYADSYNQGSRGERARERRARDEEAASDGQQRDKEAAAAAARLLAWCCWCVVLLFLLETGRAMQGSVKRRPALSPR